VAALEEVRVRTLGKSGWLTEKLKELANSPAETAQGSGRPPQPHARGIPGLHRKQAPGPRAGGRSREELAKDASTSRCRARLSARRPASRHQGAACASSNCSARPVTIESGPEIEEDFHNFEALNIPVRPSGRAMHDTFYFPDGRLLRTHTSPVQIAPMLSGKPPFAVDRARTRVSQRSRRHAFADVPPGRRTQVVDEGITFANMKAMLHGFLEAFFERDLKMRLRPSYFPFTEPSAEVDMSCVLCGGRACRVCKHTGWLEISGCGMVHPRVLEAGGVDPRKYSGYAFGMGIDRPRPCFVTA
jgi:phenylalanyl-tRNA synthetase alpha chain